MQRARGRLVTACCTVALLAMPLASACAGSESELEGGAWALVTLGGQPALTGSGASLTFGEDGALTGSTGCNLFSGSWERDGSSLTLVPGALTRRACPDPVMVQEQQFLAALEQTGQYRRDDDRLTLEDEQGRELAVFETLAAAELTGASWSAVSYNTGAQGVASVLADAPITALFSDAGELSGSTGCNEYSSSYEVDEDTLTLGPLIVTERACEPPLMEQERLYLDALQRVASLSLGAQVLELRDADGAVQVSYQSQP